MIYTESEIEKAADSILDGVTSLNKRSLEELKRKWINERDTAISNIQTLRNMESTSTDKAEWASAIGSIEDTVAVLRALIAKIDKLIQSK